MGERSDVLVFRPVLYLINIWLAQQSLLTTVLPMIEERRPWVDISTGQYDDSIAGSGIDWPKTIERWGTDEIVMKRRRRAPIDEGFRYTAAVVYELLAHSEEIVSYFETFGSQVHGPLLEILSDVGRRLKKMKDLLTDERFSAVQPTSALGEIIRSVFRSLLKSQNGKLFDGYEVDKRGLIVSHSKMRYARLLEDLRARYIEGEIWFADRAGLDLTPGRVDGLFELWCFAEMTTIIQRSVTPGVTQTSFLRRGDHEPAFSFGSSHYAYFDFSSRTFKNIPASSIFPADPDIAPALPGARVEWLIRNNENFRDSIVIDTKYYKSWDSGQALKVLGYMQNFGVRRGAVVFPCEIDAIEGRTHSRVPGLIQLKCPTIPPSYLWVLQLIPTPDSSARNDLIIRTFLEESLMGDFFDNDDKNFA